jgi:hypothetical protein
MQRITTTPRIFGLAGVIRSNVIYMRRFFIALNLLLLLDVDQSADAAYDLQSAPGVA